MENGNMRDLLQGNVRADMEKIVFRQCSPAWHIPRMRIDYANLTYIVSGEADYEVDGQPRRVKAGDLVYVRHGAVRQAQLVQGTLMRCYSVDFFLYDAAGRALDLPLPAYCAVTETALAAELFGKMNMTWLQRGELAELRLRGLFLVLLSRLPLQLPSAKGSGRTIDDRVRTVMTQIERRYSEPLTLAAFAAECGLNKVYFGMMFRRDAGLTFHQYLMNARLNAAEDLLCTGKYTIAEAAELTGFQDPSYFSRVFYRTYGVRPGRYRRLEKPVEPQGRGAEQDGQTENA